MKMPKFLRPMIWRLCAPPVLDMVTDYPPRGAVICFLDGHVGEVLGFNHFASGRAAQIRYDRNGEAWIIEAFDVERHPTVDIWREKRPSLSRKLWRAAQ